MDDLALPRHGMTSEMAAMEGFQDLPLALTDDVVPQLLLGLDNAQYIASTHFGFIEEPRRMSDNNERAMDLMAQQTELVGDRYETALLWAEEESTLPPSRHMAESRHPSLMRKLSHQPSVHEQLNQIVADYVEKGYAKKLNEDEDNDVPKRWYVPVFSVTNPNKPGKVRIVMDGAAEVDGVSLNSRLLTGPDLNAPLVHVLMKFRKGRVAVSGDIREMFNQVRIREEDQVAQRFLWQTRDESSPRVYQMMVMIFGASCSPTLAQYVKNLNADRFATEFPEAAKAIRKNHDVDDFLDSRESASAALYLAQTVRYIHQRGGFELLKFVSNDEAVTKALGGGEARVVTMSTTGTLGLEWSPTTDSFSFRCRVNRMLDEASADQLPTKRQLLRAAMSLFDPLGLVAHITVVARILLREAWRTDTAWDEIIPDTCALAWKDWLACLSSIHERPIPRWYGDLRDDPPEEVKELVKVMLVADAGTNPRILIAKDFLTWADSILQHQKLILRVTDPTRQKRSEWSSFLQ